MSFENSNKVGLISCCGIELTVGSLARSITLKVLNELRPRETMTMCLPLFLAGNEEERNFPSENPTITIDGCERLCAFRTLKIFGANSAKQIVISDILKQYDVSAPCSHNILDPDSEHMVSIIADLIATEVDKILEQQTVQYQSP